MTYSELMEKYGLRPYCASGVGDGWVPLLENLIVQLKTMGWDGSIGQIKEKFGGLRFYADNTTSDMEVVISEYESKSTETCESCGKPGKTVGTGWLKTLCEECE